MIKTEKARKTLIGARTKLLAASAVMEVVERLERAGDVPELVNIRPYISLWLERVDNALGRE